MAFNPNPNNDQDSDYSESHSPTPFSPFNHNDAQVSSPLTSHEESPSSRSTSPTPSVWSMTSSMQLDAYEEKYGRRINSKSQVYRLPADEQELERLDKQHQLFAEIMEKYPPALPQILSHDPTSSEVKAVLDLGCGTGAWIMDIANEFPHTSCVAVDLVPMQSTQMPANCRSEVDDINLGLEHFYGSFNVVNSRFITLGIKDYPRLIDQVSHVLRPGGLYSTCEAAYTIYDEYKQPIVVDANVIGAPWLPRWISLLTNTVENIAGSPHISSSLHNILSRHYAFEQVVHREYWIPLFHSPSSEYSSQISERMRDNILTFILACRPVLLSSGMPVSLLDELETNVRDELFNPSIRYHVHLTSVHCRKRPTFVSSSPQ